MGNLSRNFSRHEFECKCGCGFDTVDSELVSVLQCAVYDLEDEYKKKVIAVITGPNRCIEHNANEGGAESSQHVNAKAVDIKFFVVNEDGSKTQIDKVDVFNYFDNKYPDKYGIGIYSNRTHFDVRAKKARWDSRK